MATGNRFSNSWLLVRNSLFSAENSCVLQFHFFPEGLGQFVDVLMVSVWQRRALTVLQPRAASTKSLHSSKPKAIRSSLELVFLCWEQPLFAVSCSRTSGVNVPCALVSRNEEFRWRIGKAFEADGVHCEGTLCLKVVGEERE